VFEWAGHTRDERVRLSDGMVATEPIMRKAGGKPFLVGARIPKALDRITATIRNANYLSGLEPERFAVRAADIMAAINAVHPFREGNGRTQRIFMRELAKKAGHELDFSVISRERMIQASIAANEGRRPGMMRRLFKDAVIPARREALARAIAALDAAGFAWNDRYIAAAEPGHSVELTLAGIAGAQFMGRTSNAIIIGRSADLPSPAPSRNETFTFKPKAWLSPR
jgi:cell filamentation protein